VLKDSSVIPWTRLVALIFVATGPLLHADDNTNKVSPDGFRTVNATVNGKTVPIRVKDSADPYQSVSSQNTGKYDPENIFSQSSSMAHKSFLSPTETMKSDNDFKDTFATKSYNDPSLGTLQQSKFDTRSFPATSGTVSDYNKAYPTTSAEATKAAQLGAGADTEDQNRTAVLGGLEKPEVLTANSMANKQYLGPGAQKVPDDVYIKDNVVISRMSGLPDRPLSIDEVRNLINHGTKPDTDVPPEPPSKPLNDPDYKPEPLRDNPTPGPIPDKSRIDDDKDDPVPPPGMIAEPESAEPLPQR
jgi:hypothetical protein